MGSSYFDLTNEQIHPGNALWLDLLIGGTSTASATIALQAQTGTITAANLELTSEGELRLYDSGSFYTGFKAPTTLSGSQNYMYSLPASYGLEGQVLRSDGSGALSWVDVSDGNPTYMTLSGQQVHPKNALWHDVLVGGTSTASATIALQASTGQILASHLRLNENGYLNFGATLGDTGYGIRDNAGVMEYRNQTGDWTQIGLSIDNYWQLNDGAISPFSNTADLLIGGTSTASAKFAFNAEMGSLIHRSSVTTGTAYDLQLNSLTSGIGLNLSSTSTTYSSGYLANIDWSPSGSTQIYATGDLMRINLGAYGNVTNLLNITKDNQTLFSVSDTLITSALPHNFTSASDVSMAYDLIFTNQTASNIKTYAPFTIEVGDNFESNDLTLKTNNYGVISLNPSQGSVGVGTNFMPRGLFHVHGQKTGKALAIFNETGDQHILSASASGVTVANLTRTGDLELLNQGQLRLYDTTGYYTGFRAPADLTGTQNYVYTLPANYGTDGQILTTNGSGVLTWTTVNSGGSGANDNYWQLNDGAISPFSNTADLLIGGTSTASAKFAFNAEMGSLIHRSSVTTGTAYDLQLNSLTSGIGLNLSSTSTTYSSGYLANIDWSPSGSTQIYATGDLMRINLGAYGNVTNLLNITKDNQTLFSVSDTLITSALPHNFTSASDVSMAYDLIFTNQTASNIKTYAPLTIEVGENFESNDLTLKTFNLGSILLDPANGGVGVGKDVTPNTLFHVEGAQTGKALTIFNETGNQHIFTASASGTTVANLTRTGDLELLNQGQLRLYDTTGYYTGFRAPADLTGTSNYMYTLPANYGTGGHILTTNGSGTLAWTDAAGVGTNYWQLNEGALAPFSVTADLLIGGTSTASAKIALNAQTGTISGPSLTLQTSGTGNIFLIPASSGKVVIGNGSADLKLSVSDSQSATAAAIFENIHAGDDAAGILVKLGFTGQGNTNNNFVTFLNGNGTIQGKINSNGDGGIVYSTSGVDLAEYFIKDDSIFIEGELVAVSQGGATKTTGEYQSNMIGIVSKHPGFTGGTAGPNKVLVGIVGQVPVLISPNSAPIQAGDLLTSSSDPSKAQKATRPGHVVGKALEPWTPESGKASILTYINVGYGDPNGTLAFDQNGNLNLSGNLSLNGTLLVQGRNILDDLNTLQATTNTITTQVNGLQASIGTINSDLAAINHRISKLDESFFTGRLGVGLEAPATDSGKLIDTSSGAYLSQSGVWTNVSDENKKENYTSINKDLILDQIANLRITQWNYISDR
jgi:hypothetical protein